MTGELHLGVALEGYGWHPQAWRYTADAPPVTSGRYWSAVATTAERGLLDFVTFDDSLTPQRRRRPEIKPGWLAGRPDAVLVAARVAPVTRHLGLIPVATTTHTTPVNVSKALATLGLLSHGRAGWQARISGTRHEAELFGRRDPDNLGDLFAEASDAVEVVRRLWPPQVQPVVAALAHNPRVYEFAARSADLVFITPRDDDSLATIMAEVADAGGQDLQVYADIYVTFSGEVDDRSDATVFHGSPDELANWILRWNRLGLDGIRLRPAVTATDLPVIVDELVPLLQQAGGFRSAYRDGETLRERLGLPVAVNHYARETNS